MKNKLVKLLMILIMVLSLASCNVEKKENESDKHKPDEKTTSEKSATAKAEGYGGEVSVTVTVDGKKITKVEAVGEKETDKIGTIALEKLPQQIVEHQSIAVDTISTATKTSVAVLAAAKEALLQLGFSEDEINKEIVIEVGEKITKETDVVIIGGGGAGLSAAVEALKAGKSVTIIEKTAGLGGNTRAAGSAMNAADPELQKNQKMSKQEMDRIEDILNLASKNDIMKKWQDTLKKEIDEYKEKGEDYLFDSPSLHKLQTYIDGDYVADPVLVDIYGDEALNSVKFLEELGAEFHSNISAAVGATWKRSHTPTYKFGEKGADFVEPQIKFVTDNGADIMLDSKAESLLIEDGKVIGVSGKTTSGQEFEVKAKNGVVIATGGFGANIEMRVKYNKHWENLGEEIQTTNVPSATGDGITMAEKANAALEGMEYIQLIPTYFGGVVTPYIDNQIYINQEGERFINEDNRRDVLSAETLKQTNSSLYIINDKDTIDENNIVAVTGRDVTSKIGKEDLYKADSLEDLAKQINVPYETLKKTIDEFNESVESGKDRFGRTLFDKKIDEAPFWAGKTKPAVHHTMGGIKINEKTQVLDINGEVIPGLFAAGEVTGGIHGSNRLGGNAITDVITFGRLAGKNVSK